MKTLTNRELGRLNVGLFILFFLHGKPGSPECSGQYNLATVLES